VHMTSSARAMPAPVVVYAAGSRIAGSRGGCCAQPGVLHRAVRVGKENASLRASNSNWIDVALAATFRTRGVDLGCLSGFELYPTRPC